MSEFTPREIVSELDRFIVGQPEAKRAVALALRNRWRRKQLADGLREEVTPKNILMIGPTGVGKTEISRRLARLAKAPFLKVEATKFTEVGYVGRDVEQIIRDLVEIAIGMVRERRRKEVQAKAEAKAEERVLDALVGATAQPSTRESFRAKLRAGQLDDKEIEVDVADTSSPSAASRSPASPARHRHDQPVGHAVEILRRPHQAHPHHGEGSLQAADRRKNPTSSSTARASRARRCASPRKTASSSSTRSTRSPRAPNAPARMSRAKACSAICCR